MALKEEIIRALENLNLKSLVVDFERSPSGKIGAVIISDSFSRKTMIDRQNLIWDHLEKVLGKNKVSKIIGLITLTHKEADGAYSKT